MQPGLRESQCTDIYKRTSSVLREGTITPGEGAKARWGPGADSRCHVRVGRVLDGGDVTSSSSVVDRRPPTSIHGKIAEVGDSVRTAHAMILLASLARSSHGTSLL